MRVCGRYGNGKIKRPPQSWCYVEEQKRMSEIKSCCGMSAMAT